MSRFPPLLFVIVCSFGLGCGQDPSEICRQYVACQAEYDAASATGPVDTAQYEDEGLCWASADNAARCDQQCSDGLAAVREAAANANLDVPACD